jgi:hypothetical protein
MESVTDVQGIKPNTNSYWCQIRNSGACPSDSGSFSQFVRTIHFCRREICFWLTNFRFEWRSAMERAKTMSLYSFTFFIVQWITRASYSIHCVSLIVSLWQLTNWFRYRSHSQKYVPCTRKSQYIGHKWTYNSCNGCNTFSICITR